MYSIQGSGSSRQPAVEPNVAQYQARAQSGGDAGENWDDVSIFNLNIDDKCNILKYQLLF